MPQTLSTERSPPLRHTCTAHTCTHAHARGVAATQAAALAMRDPERYKARIKGATPAPRRPLRPPLISPPLSACCAEYVEKFGQAAAEAEADDDEEMSEDDD